MSAIRVKYIGGDARFSELGITGQQQMWRPGQSSFVEAANAAAMVASGQFVYADSTPVFLSRDSSGNPVGLVADGKVIAIGGGAPVVVSADAPSNADGRPDGTVYIQTS